MLTKDDIHTLANVVIPNLMQIDLFPNLAQPKDLLPPIDSNKKKKTIATNIPLINSSL